MEELLSFSQLDGLLGDPSPFLASLSDGLEETLHPNHMIDVVAHTPPVVKS